MTRVFLERALREIDHAIKASGRKLATCIENASSPVPQIVIFDEFVGNGPLLVCMVSEGGFIPIRSFGKILPLDVQRPLGFRKLRRLIYAMPRAGNEPFERLDAASVVMGIRKFWSQYNPL